MFIRFACVHIAMLIATYACRLAIYPTISYIILKNIEINATCNYNYQYIKYKHLAMPNKNYTTCTVSTIIG